MSCLCAIVRIVLVVVFTASFPASRPKLTRGRTTVDVTCTSVRAPVAILNYEDKELAAAVGNVIRLWREIERPKPRTEVALKTRQASTPPQSRPLFRLRLPPSRQSLSDPLC